MYQPDKNDTIVAIATPLGPGGVGIVRLSGKESLKLALQLFTSAKSDFQGVKPYRLHHGWIKDYKGRTLDEVLLTYMPGPGSYTGEDVVEFNCHGGPAILQSLVETLVSLGARPAEPGEFTYRAFLNGRLDLTQAEAVAEMITAPTRASISMAQAKLKGLLKQKITELRLKLENLRQDLCVAVDFPEEDLECLPREQLVQKVKDCIQEINELIDNYKQEHIWQDGALVVLAGRVNAGKSSLLNALLGRERAIVTDIPGTTRDYLEETINLQGLPVRLVDTAGLRRTNNIVEKEGFLRGQELISKADLCLVVIDSQLGISHEDRNILRNLAADKVILVANKMDLIETEPDWTNEFKEKNLDLLFISAKYGQGLKELTTLIRKKIIGHKKEPEPGRLVPNLRQKNSLEKARDELSVLAEEAKKEIPYDLLGTRLDYACTLLAEITGEITPDDVLNRIFENFCIGK
ncbi:tRNA uridine-5-carboxymethylaminomethyl(34) synthesis GTPase MnmE [Desulfohalobiaceae bacterium Ax17]|uniref:tRNA uridine-5-carboxymethylaminomethyl(34) synthesis GTPase MnmE n=1 Tax=Desulfovulcanus ferrireducens TaxID=2831190 RepID=UPI00207BBA58|nr:tRNA uridine-5-carboxymethylaminomethyl(34) synthesis GTPase MnmE [Desulfovulcanus ferrireducens]MBT8763303.1 tRNA uridine-5-carboxymethylaminomethyl(34) synthesis GTPase MnmE [Desulfovulcanus ferrireducens]